MIDFIARAYRILIKSAVYLAPFVLLLIRAGWGWEMFEAGRGHLTHLDQTASFFASLHIPAPRASAMISGTTETVGGALLMVGLAARLIAIPLAFNFLVAILTASSDNVKLIFNQDFSKIVDDTAFPLLIASLVILAFGPGLFSLDALLKKTVMKKYATGLK
jgi:putative oxidoreductase